jgi:PAS domain S-box-containing protein
VVFPVSKPASLLVVSDDAEFPDSVADAVGIDPDAVRALGPAAVGGTPDADCAVCDDTAGDLPTVAQRLRADDPHFPVLAVGDDALGRTAAAADARWVPEAEWKAVLAERVERASERYREVRSGRETATYFSALTDEAPFATVITDAAETVVYASPAVEDLFGYAPEELIGEPAEALIPETFRERHHRAMERYMKSGARHLDWSGVSLIAEHRSGEEVPVDVSLGTTVRGDERYFAALFRAEDAPAEESARFRKHEAFSESVFENASDVIFVVDAGTRTVIDANPAASDVLGYDYRDLLDTDLTSLFVEGDPPEPGAAERAAVTFRTADGDERVLDVAAATLTYEGESALLYSGPDVTERRRRAAELERQNERLEEFVSIVSHDLRNPLNVATANAQLVAEGNHERVGMLREALEDMEGLIEDLLSLAKQGQVVSESDIRTIALEPLVREAWESVNPPGESELAVTEDCTFRADRDRTEQALANLFRNAVEHAGPGVTVTAGALPNGVGFFVEDDGPGIPPEKRADVLAAGYTTAEGGTGYGLAIVAEIAEAHGWELAVTGSGTGGARFEFYTG